MIQSIFWPVSRDFERPLSCEIVFFRDLSFFLFSCFWKVLWPPPPKKKCGLGPVLTNSLALLGVGSCPYVASLFFSLVWLPFTPCFSVYGVSSLSVFLVVGALLLSPCSPPSVFGVVVCLTGLVWGGCVHLSLLCVILTKH